MAANRRSLREELKGAIIRKMGPPVAAESLEEAIQETTLRIYRCIEEGQPINNIRGYFFTVCLREYRSLLANMKYRYYEPETETETDPTMTAAERLSLLRNRIEKAYGKEQADLYMEYMETKVMSPFCSYATFAARKGISEYEVASTVRRIGKWVKGKGKV